MTEGRTSSARVLRRLTAALAAWISVHSAAWAGVNAWSATGPDGGVTRAAAWHPARDGVVIASAGAIYRSTDRGVTWTAASSKIAVSTQIAFDPLNADRILVAGTELLRSVDG